MKTRKVVIEGYDFWLWVGIPCIIGHIWILLQTIHFIGDHV